jgi:tetratricopeptide (TPR) repeat protein
VVVRAPASLAALEQRLVEVRAKTPGGREELAALVELAAHLVPDPIRRGELAREGAALAERLGDDAARLRCEAMLAEYQARHQHPADALQTALRTVTEADRIGDRLACAQAHHSVAHCFEALDCIPEALEHVHQALSAYQAAGDAFGEGRILSSLAELYCELGEERRARGLFERAHDIFVEYGEPNGAAAMLVSISTIDRQAGDPAAAAVTIERALERYEQAGMPLDSAIAMATYAEALADLGRLDEAALWAKRGLDRNRTPDGSVSNPIYEINMLLTLAASVQLPQGDLPGARTTLERAVALAGELGAIRLAPRVTPCCPRPYAGVATSSRRTSICGAVANLPAKSAAPRTTGGYAPCGCGSRWSTPSAKPPGTARRRAHRRRSSWNWSGPRPSWRSEWPSWNGSTPRSCSSAVPIR